MKTKLYIMVGNVGSGKSTWIKKFLANCEDEKWVVVSKDAIRWMLGGGDKYLFDPDCLEKFIDAQTKEMIRSLIRNSVNVIVDETNEDVLSRRSILDLVPPGVETTAVCMAFVPKEESLRRKSNVDANYGYGSKVWCDVWDKKKAQSTEPTTDEGFDKLLYIG